MKLLVLCFLMINVQAWASSAKDFEFSFKLIGCSDGSNELRCCAIDLKNNITGESFDQAVFKIDFVPGEKVYEAFKIDYCKSTDTKGTILVVQGNVEIKNADKAKKTRRTLKVIEIKKIGASL